MTLSATLFNEMTGHFHLGFPRYEMQREAVIDAFRKILTEENIRAVLKPDKFIHPADIAALAPRIKEKEITLKELKQYGVIPSFTLIKPAGDDNGGDDAYDVYLHASLYVLPSTLALAKKATLDHDQYKKYKPHVQESLSCRLPSGEEGYYVEVGAFKVGGAMVVQTKNPSETIGHYHLAPQCTDKKGGVRQSDHVRYFDGMKIFIPVVVEEEGCSVEKTIVLSSAITVWGGVAAFALDHFGSAEDNALAYGLGGLSEQLMVILSRSEKQNPTAAK